MDIEEWINTKMRASQNKKELLTLYHEVAKLPPWVIVEIGVHRGYSLEAWSTMFPKAENIIGIELHLEDLDRDVLVGRPHILVIGGDSHEQASVDSIKQVLNGRKIDFLFIDGDHTYDSVKKDFETYGALVRKGGIIALHDAALTDNPQVEVYKLWKEINEEPYERRKIIGTMLTQGTEGSGDALEIKGTGTGIIFL